MSIRVLHILPSVGRASFGLGQVAVNLAKEQNNLNVDVWVWCLDTAEQIDWAVTQSGLSRDKVRGFHHNGFTRLGYSYGMLSAVKTEGVFFNVVHQHGIWTACSHTTNRLREIYGIPTVIAPHGSLQRWALTRSTWKKRIASLLYEQKNLHEAACLHATSEAEIADFRNYGLSNPIALIDNGVSERWLETKGESFSFRKHFAIQPNKRILLFLSRITPKKGLPILLDAINNIRKNFDDWLLVIAGTDEFGHLKEVETLVEKMNLRSFVKFTGPLYGQAKIDAFAAADAFVLPSYSEGAPMVVLDSLAAGVPVITTKGSPWGDLITHQCGWWVEASVDGIVDALRRMTALSSVQLKNMGKRGKELVRTRYLWSVQAQKTQDLYSWLLGQKSKPDFVIND